MITDVSDGGVKIIAEYPEIPSEFTVILPDRASASWRGDRLRTGAQLSIRAKNRRQSAGEQSRPPRPQAVSDTKRHGSGHWLALDRACLTRI
jgi:hypothetical protein